VDTYARYGVIDEAPREGKGMVDIKLTLSSNPTMRSPSIEEEAQWLEKEGALYYQLQAKPIRASDGCWVYFIRNSQLVARAKAGDFRWMAKEELGGSYAGVLPGKGSWRVKVIPPMELTSYPIPHLGVQGFHYIRLEEQADFENAFAEVENVWVGIANSGNFTLPEEVEEASTIYEGLCGKYPSTLMSGVPRRVESASRIMARLATSVNSTLPQFMVMPDKASSMSIICDGSLR